MRIRVRRQVCAVAGSGRTGCGICGGEQGRNVKQERSRHVAEEGMWESEGGAVIRKEMGSGEESGGQGLQGGCGFALEQHVCGHGSR